MASSTTKPILYLDVYKASVSYYDQNRITARLAGIDPEQVEHTAQSLRIAFIEGACYVFELINCEHEADVLERALTLEKKGVEKVANE